MIYVLFGSESNNAADLADRTGAALMKAGHEATVVDMSSFDAAQLDAIGTVLVVTSTYGNGNPPSNAEALHGALMARTQPLPKLRFAVCGLGDTTYDRFAQCGKDFDTKLAELGATRIAARQDCDVDYEEPWQAWLDTVLAKLAEFPAAPSAEAPIAPAPSTSRLHPPGTRRNPATARMLRTRPLCGAGSTKEVIHVELSIDPALAYECGDSLGLFAENDPAVVDEILAKLGAKGDETVSLTGAMHEGARGGGTMALRDALLSHLDLQHVDSRLFDACGLPRSADVHVIDLVAARTQTPELQTFALCLRPLAPRAYSISSSPTVHPHQAHLTVDVVRYVMRGRKRAGVASSMLADRAPPGYEFDAYVQPAPHFRLPAPDVPIVMIGPGTGIAPFRAFLEERARTGATGKNWLLFGARNACDFYYETELRDFAARGVLTRLDCAFSRERRSSECGRATYTPADQPERVYVQHRMRENQDELYRWLADGAIVYVCGNAQRMAPDVQAALIDVLAAGSGRDGVEELRKLESEERYRKDVY